MNITEIKSEIAGDSYYKVEHPSGLTIFVYPKEGYTSSYAIFGTRYGSINTKFPTVSPITLNTSFLKVKKAMRL